MTELRFCVTRTTSSSPITVNTEVSLTIPMNMLPMFGIAIFVACGRMIWTNTRSGLHAEREPRLPLAARNRLERGAVDLGDEGAVEQHQRDHARLEDREVDPEQRATSRSRPRSR